MEMCKSNSNLNELNRFSLITQQQAIVYLENDIKFFSAKDVKTYSLKFEVLMINAKERKLWNLVFIACLCPATNWLGDFTCMLFASILSVQGGVMLDHCQGLSNCDPKRHNTYSQLYAIELPRNFII